VCCLRRDRDTGGGRPGKLTRDCARYNQLQDERAAGDIPECATCESPLADPLLDIETLDPEDLEKAQEDCEACHLNSEEYEELTTYGDLFRWCIDQIRRRELGLEIGRDQLSWREEQAILHVHGQLEDGKARRIEQMRENAGTRDEDR